MKKLMLLTGIAALLTAGCRLDASVTLDVAEDGSGQYVIEAGIDQELRDLLGQFGVSAEDLVQTLQSGLPEGSSATREEGDLTYFVNTVEFTSPDQVVDTIAGAGGDSLFDTFVLEVDEDGARIEARLDVDLADVPFDASQLQADTLRANFYARLPGNLVDHNADEQLPDGRLRWSLPITGGEIDIQARTSFGSDGFPLWLAIVGGVVAIGAIGFFLLVRVGRREQDALAATEAPPPPLDFTPPPPETAGPADNAAE